jgi:mono/diheme cytochrome c family protein
MTPRPTTRGRRSLARRSVRIALTVLAASSLVACTTATAAAATKGEVNFSRDVKPLLARRCFACHGPDAGEGGLRFGDRESALAELDSGLHAIVPGNVDESALIDRITATDEFERMPPEGKPLTAEEVDLLRRWIEQGAPWQKHWAFVPPVKHDLPSVNQSEWVQNPIDAFILGGLEQADLEPAPPADRRTLARRAYFDLTGLPPTQEQLATFLADVAPSAWPRLIDGLLASPHYGERWARHWLDVVRYAETNSFERDGAKPNVWKYRDYVIRSFNDDKPYDQFLREQLAGDELDEVTKDSIIATGYYRLGIWDDEPADPVQARYDEFDDLISTTSQAMLGLTVGCARCHDHKIDPIPQSDYYGLLAFFADVTPYGTRSEGPARNSEWDMASPDDRDERRRLERELRRTRRKMTAIEESGIKRMSAPDQRRSEGPEREELLAEKLQANLNPSEWDQYVETRDRLNDIELNIDELPPLEAALALATCEPHPEPTHIMQRGNPHVPGDVVEPHFPALFGDEAPQIPPAPDGARSAGRRRVLADWIASPENMLTARVIVNRVWQHHFGRGIVRSANNFGELGDVPTHPELLDWLALWLVENNWQLKPLHRLIMTSAAYQMSSQANERALAADPLNDLFWRYDMRRLSAEEIRDATLVVTDQFNPKMFGPSFYEQLSDEVLATQSQPGNGWGDSSEEERNRRAIYIHVKRSLLTPLLTAFDFPDVDTSCEARFMTVQPAQALTMLNGAYLNEKAADLAERVRLATGDDASTDEQVCKTIEFALGRPADDDEAAEGVELMQQLVNEHDKSPEDALRYWCLAVLNVNEFNFLD